MTKTLPPHERVLALLKKSKAPMKLAHILRETHVEAVVVRAMIQSGILVLMGGKIAIQNPNAPYIPARPRLRPFKSRAPHGPESKRPQRWKNEDRANALRISAKHGFHEAARVLGIPAGTISGWLSLHRHHSLNEAGEFVVPPYPLEDTPDDQVFKAHRVDISMMNPRSQKLVTEILRLLRQRPMTRQELKEQLGASEREMETTRQSLKDRGVLAYGSPWRLQNKVFEIHVNQDELSSPELIATAPPPPPVVTPPAPPQVSSRLDTLQVELLGQLLDKLQVQRFNQEEPLESTLRLVAAVTRAGGGE